MKYLKKYEYKTIEIDFDKKSYFEFEDDYLKIHKIKNGENKGKIFFKFFEDYALIASSSLMLGCAKILDSKYEKDKNIRDIEISGHIKFRKIQPNTMEAILKIFVSKIGYPEKEAKNILSKITKDGFNEIVSIDNDIRMIALRSKNLGEVLDGLKKIQESFIESKIERFKEWEFQNNIKNFNL